MFGTKLTRYYFLSKSQKYRKVNFRIYAFKMNVSCGFRGQRIPYCFGKILYSIIILFLFLLLRTLYAITRYNFTAY